MNNLFVVSKYAFLELYKSKILLNVVILGFFLLIIATVASEFTYGVPEKVALNFGLGLLSLSLVAVATFMGATLVSREMENRTLYMILSRPVDRYVFLIGRILGLTGILFLNAFILSFFTLSLFLVLDGELTALIFHSIIFSYLESVLVMLVVVLFSLFSNTVISVLFTLTIYVCGHGIEAVKQTKLVDANEFLAFFINIYSKIMPNFTKLNIKNYVFYEDLIEIDFLASSYLYAFLYCLILVILSCLVFNKKELT